MNIIQTRSIGKVILNETTPQRPSRFEHYAIPYYQRGYQWVLENVYALFDDIHNFIQSSESNLLSSAHSCNFKSESGRSYYLEIYR